MFRRLLFLTFMLGSILLIPENSVLRAQANRFRRSRLQATSTMLGLLIWPSI
jgi:hypothetical protein